MSAQPAMTVQVDGNGPRNATSVPYGARLRVLEDGDEGQARPALAEWDPYTTPIITEKSAAAMRYEDLVENFSGPRAPGRSHRHSSNRVVIDWRSIDARVRTCVRRMAVIDADERLYVASSPTAVRPVTSCPVGAILSVGDGDAGRSLARSWPVSCHVKVAKTRDITGGLPRVAELFEARRPKDCAVISRDGRPRGVRQVTTRISAASRSRRSR
jgi:DNA-directed RNA polymerase subunit beta'